MEDSKERFSSRVADYARFRPTYPREIIEAVLDGLPAPAVADLGAGTGISSRLLAQGGATVFAVEPNAPMRSEIEADANITPVDGTAEATTLPPASVDIVTAFQAYHWFAPQEALIEAERILRARGRSAAVWYERDARDAFTREFGAIIAGYMTDDTEARRERSRAAFLELHERAWGNARVVGVPMRVEVDWDGLIGRARSASYLPREGPAYESMASELRALYDRAAEYGGARFVMVTQAYLSDRQ